MRRLQILIIAIGLVLLISGITLVGAAATGLISNEQYHYKRTRMSALQLTPTEYTLFNETLDENDKAHIHIAGESFIVDVSLDEQWAIMPRYNISLYIKDSQNVTLGYDEYSSKTSITTFEAEHQRGDVYTLDIFFQAQKYDKYEMFVSYVAWLERAPFHGTYQDINPWSFWDRPSTTIDTLLDSDIDIQKTTPNFTYIILGVVVLSIGVVLIPVSLVKKLR